MTQKNLLSRTAGERVSISCEGISGCSQYVEWYQKKDSGTFERLLYINKDDGRVTRYAHPQKGHFSAEVQQNSCNLILRSAKVSHTAAYYCYCYTGAPQ